MEHIKNVHENTDHRPSNYFSTNSLIAPIGKQGSEGMGIFLKEYLLMLIICFCILGGIFLIIHYFKSKNKKFPNFKKL